MKRRDFITSLLGVVAASCVPTGRTKIQPVPKWHEATYKGQLTAEQFLTKCYNDFTKGTGSAYTPKAMFVSRDLYESYEANLQCLQRFVYTDRVSPGHRALAFKCCRVYKMPDHWARGWKVVLSKNCETHDTFESYSADKTYDLSNWQS